MANKTTPGYKTSEFWLSSATLALGQLMASGAVADGSLAAKIIGGALALLSGIGYTYLRTSLKK